MSSSNQSGQPEPRPWGSLSWPNRISILRLLFIVPFIVLVMNQHAWPGARYGALGIFLVMAFSDMLDGILARRLNAETRLGAILDPLADKALIICAAVLLSLPGSAVAGARVANWVVVAIVAKDLWVIVGFLVIYLVTDRFRIYPTKSGKLSTVMQLFMVASVLTAPDLNYLYAGLGSRIADVAGWAVAVCSGIAIMNYSRLGLSFIAVEEKPLEKHTPPG